MRHGRVISLCTRSGLLTEALCSEVLCCVEPCRFVLCFDDAAGLCAGDDAETAPPKWQDSYYTSVTESQLTQEKKRHVTP